jgi:hypothetical protein
MASSTDRHYFSDATTFDVPGHAQAAALPGQPGFGVEGFSAAQNKSALRPGVGAAIAASHRFCLPA